MKTLLFPGQGSQFVGMGKDLYDNYPAAKKVFAEADSVLGFSLSQIMFEGPEETLRETRNAQPAILTHSVAAWRSMAADWTDSEMQAAGHSLGEYSAYTIAGVFSFADAVRIVRRRGELMYEAGTAQPGAMAAIIGLSGDLVSEVCASVDGVVTPANINSPGQVVISGTPEAVKSAGELLKEKGARKVVELNVSGAFHSPLMEPAAAGLKAALAEVTVGNASFPVYANASAKPVTDCVEIRESLVRQLLSPVLWEPTIRALMPQSSGEWFEIGPGQVLRGLVRQTERSLKCQTFGTADEVKSFLVD
jgi:[acyl-carrier-protein] S-malonyltransferase